VNRTVVPVHLPDEGLPWWQVLPLTLLGCAIAFGILYLLARLLQRRKR
jgi:hypothetical protein